MSTYGTGSYGSGTYGNLGGGGASVVIIAPAAVANARIVAPLVIGGTPVPVSQLGPSAYIDGSLDNGRWEGTAHASRSYRGGPYYPNVAGGRALRVRVRPYWELLRAGGAASVWRLIDTDPGRSVVGPVVDSVGTRDLKTTGESASAVSFREPPLLYGDNDELTARFDSIDDRLTGGDHYRFPGTAPFTLSAVVYTDAGAIALDSVRRTIVSNVRTDAGGKQGWELTVLNKRLRVSRWRNGVEQYAEYATDLLPLTIYVFHAVYTGVALRLYINGSIQGVTVSSQLLLDVAGAIAVGNIAAGGQGWLGRISSVALHEFDLSAEEILAQFNKAEWAFQGPIFRGQIEDVPMDWRSRRPVVQMTVNDAFETLSSAVISGYRAIEYSGARIGWALDQANFAGGRAIDYGRSLVEESSSLAGTLLDNDASLDHLLDIAEAEVGLFFIGADGSAIFHDRLRRSLSATYIQDTFTNDPVNTSPGAKLAIEIVPSKSVRDVLNDIRLRPIAGQTDAVARDLGSQLDGIRSLSRSIWLTSLPECQSQAEWLLGQYKTQKLRFDSLTFDVKRDPGPLLASALDREISDRIKVEYRAPSGQPGMVDLAGPVVTVECHIEGISHEITTENGRTSWRVTWALSSAVTQQFWILGDPSGSLLGVSTVLGY